MQPSAMDEKNNGAQTADILEPKLYASRSKGTVETKRADAMPNAGSLRDSNPLARAKAEKYRKATCVREAEDGQSPSKAIPDDNARRLSFTTVR